MQTLELQSVMEEPKEEAYTLYPDYLIGRLMREGIGMIEADYSLQQDGMVDFVFTSRKLSEPKIVARVRPGFFRPALARFGFKCGVKNLYCGHTLFACEHECEGKIRMHRFSLFISNLIGTGFWIRLYLYTIDGIHPIKSDVGRNQPS